MLFMSWLVRSWDHHDLLSVVPEYNESNHCSTSARLRSIAPYTGRKETAVYAADVRTGTVVHCKVYIDMFSKIQIFHSSVKLDLDGLTTLRVRAFDRQGNLKTLILTYVPDIEPFVLLVVFLGMPFLSFSGNNIYGYLYAFDNR